MAISSIYMSNLQKVRIIRAIVYIIVIMLFLVCFHCSLLRISPGQVENYQLFVSFAGLRPQYISTQEQVKKYCNWGKESYLTTLNN